MNLTERAILRLLAYEPMTTAMLLVGLGFHTRQSHKVVLLVCARLRERRLIARHQTHRQGVHVWILLSTNSHIDASALNATGV